MYEFKPRLLKRQTITRRRLPLPPPVQFVTPRIPSFGDGVIVGSLLTAALAAVGMVLL